ncbi:hypothetical protein BGZ73_007321 [Actinomortierella ambigua]|nr:hypothetical protein BGZ73_007321 [Actinomortierella ambigua]
MVAIALQEIAPYPDAFLHGTYNIQAKINHTANLIRNTLHKTCPGYQFSLLSQESQVGMTLFVFSRDETMTPYVQSVANASVGTGPLGMGNKGAVAIKVAVSLPYPSRPFEVCFLNAHLSAHLNKIQRRNDDYLAICRRMIFVEEKERMDNENDYGDDSEDLYHMDQDQQPLLGGGRSSNGAPTERSRKRIMNRTKKPKKFGSSKKPSVEKTIFSCDYIFWTGDLNYRLDLEESDGSLCKKKKKMQKKPSREDLLLSQPTPPPMTATEFVHAIESGHYRQLYAHDQLSAQRKTMNVFKDFREAPLAFAPTYKFRMGTSKYDIRKRIPAWTDRVLWYVHPHDETSVEQATVDEVDAWDEHSTGLGYGKLPMESTLRRSRSYNVSSSSEGVGTAPATVESIAAAANVLEGPLRKSLAAHRSDSVSVNSSTGGGVGAGTWSGSRSRGTFSSLAKRGSARLPMDPQMFQPPPTSSSSTAAPLVHSPSSMSLASQSSGTTMAHPHTGSTGHIAGGEPSLVTMASSASLLSNRSGRNSGGFGASYPGVGSAAAAGGVGVGGGTLSGASTFMSTSSSSSLLQPQQVAQGVETTRSPLLIHYYTSHPYYVSSDHKPVSALFTLLPHNLATQMQVSPYGIDPHWRLKKYIGKKLTTVVGHLLRWGFLVLGFLVLAGLFVFVRRHLHGW